MVDSNTLLGLSEVLVDVGPVLVRSGGPVIVEDRVDIVAGHGRRILQLVDRGETHHDNEETEGEGEHDDDSDTHDDRAHDDFFLGSVTVFPKDVSRFGGTAQLKLVSQQFLVFLGHGVNPAKFTVNLVPVVGEVVAATLEGLLSLESDESGDGTFDGFLFVLDKVINLLVDSSKFLELSLSDNVTTVQKESDHFLVVISEGNVSNLDIFLLDDDRQLLKTIDDLIL